MLSLLFGAGHGLITIYRSFVQLHNLMLPRVKSAHLKILWFPWHWVKVQIRGTTQYQALTHLFLMVITELIQMTSVVNQN